MYPSPNSQVEILTPNVTVLTNGALGSDYVSSRDFVNGFSAGTKGISESFFTPSPVMRTQQENGH